MRKYFVALLTLLVFLVPAQGVKANAQDFTFSSFTGDYYLSSSDDRVAQLDVTERLEAEFPQTNQNHGILRAIPEDYQGHPLELRVKKITLAGSDGQSADVSYTTSHQNGNLVLKIGDAQAYVKGKQTYVIEYSMRGVTLQLDDHEEFFWDINGDQWEQPFKRVEARVHVPASMAEALQNRWGCYAGSVGLQDARKCSAVVTKKVDGSKQVTFATNGGYQVSPNQTMTIVLGFNKGTFAGYIPSAAQVQQWAGIAAAIVVPPLIGIAFVVNRWLRKGRDPKDKNAIVPQYLPPKEMGVISSGIILKEGVDSKAMTAAIIDLAVRHYIKIYETKQKGLFTSPRYELVLTKEAIDLRPEEQSTLKMIFKDGHINSRVKLDDLTAKLFVKVKEAGSAVEQRLVTEGYFTVKPQKAKLPYYITGVLLLFVGFFIAFAHVIGIGLLLSGVVLLACAHIMPARTMKGVAMRNYLLGVRDYMKLAEADRIQALQSPHGDLTEKIDVGDNTQLVNLYERLLPYAILFGLEKGWAKEMAGLYKEAPDWYQGNSTFNAVWFAASFNSFSTSAATTFAPPSSSSGSGFGGGAGGGGGGGGGGGW